MIIKNILLNVLALFAILSSIFVITSQNPVISVLYLISLFINTAGYLILIGIDFVGIAYILVYIGAITVLFLFVIMMINIKLVDILEVGREYTKNLPLALSISFIFLYLISSISNINSQTLLENSNIAIINNINIFNELLQFDINNLPVVLSGIFNHINLDINFVQFLQIEMLGQGLYTYGAFWLILSSIILLLSMVAPIILSTPTNKN